MLVRVGNDGRAGWERGRGGNRREVPRRRGKCGRASVPSFVRVNGMTTRTEGQNQERRVKTLGCFWDLLLVCRVRAWCFGRTSGLLRLRFLLGARRARCRELEA